MSETALEAIDVVKVLGKGAGRVEALKGVSLSVATGELALLMGPSGSGKTTLLSILGCLLTPTRGTVRIHGQAIDKAGVEDLAKLRRDNFGYVFQIYHLFPTLNALDNVRLALDVRAGGPWRTAARAKEALAQVGLSHKLRSYPRDLSGGEQQRVAIARAIVANPSIILADEPTAALDGENGRLILSILRTMARERGCAVLVVTHDTRLLPFADRIINIEDGRIVGEEKSDAPSRHIAQIAQIAGQLSAAAARSSNEPRVERIGRTGHGNQ